MVDRPTLGFAYFPPPGSVCIAKRCKRAVQGAVVVFIPQQDGPEKIKLAVPSCDQWEHRQLAEKELDRQLLQRQKELQEDLQRRKEARLFAQLAEEFEAPEPDLLEQIDELLS